MSDYIQDLTGFYTGNTMVYHDEVRVVTRPFDGTLPFLTLQAGDANEAVDVREVKPATSGVVYGSRGRSKRTCRRDADALSRGIGSLKG